MSLSKEQLTTLKDLVYIARTTLSVPAATNARLDQLATAIKQGWYATWADTDRRSLLLLVASTPDGLYPLNRAVIDAFAAEIGVSLDDGPVPSPQPDPAPIPIPVPPAPSGGVLTDPEISAVRDINYTARKEYGTDGTTVWDRFIAMSEALRLGTYKQWMDVDRGLLLSMMAATSAGVYGPNRAMLDKFATSIGVTIRSVSAPDGTTPVPVSDPPSMPPVEYGLWDTTPKPLRSFQSGPDFAAEVLEIVRKNTVVFDEKVGFGMDPIQNTEGVATMFGGGIVGVAISNFQNDDEQMLPAGVVPKHANYLDICNSDGGGRWMQYGWYHMGAVIRNTINRIFTIRALADSQGEACWSREQLANGAAGPKGQVFYEKVDHARKEVHLSVFQPGWKIVLKGSSVYGGNDIDLVQQAIDAAFAKRGL